MLLVSVISEHAAAPLNPESATDIELHSVTSYYNAQLHADVHHRLRTVNRPTLVQAFIGMQIQAIACV